MNNNLNYFEIIRNRYLSKNISGYYRTLYYGYHDPRTPKYICTIKNTFNNKKEIELKSAILDLKNGTTIHHEILEVMEREKYLYSNTNICIMPRSKVRSHSFIEGHSFAAGQFLFFTTIQKVIQEISKKINYNIDGSEYIVRYKNTKTTHLIKCGKAGDGDAPYPGLANDTCTFSNEIYGKNIILIDDLYTKTINILEDMAQALFNHGAKNVTIFSIGYTAKRGT